MAEATLYVIQVDTSIRGNDGLWTDFTQTDVPDRADRYFDETVKEYPHRQVRLVKRVTVESIVRRGNTRT